MLVNALMLMLLMLMFYSSRGEIFLQAHTAIGQQISKITGDSRCIYINLIFILETILKSYNAEMLPLSNEPSHVPDVLCSIL